MNGGSYTIITTDCTSFYQNDPYKFVTAVLDEETLQYNNWLQFWKFVDRQLLRYQYFISHKQSIVASKYRFVPTNAFLCRWNK